MAIDLGKDPGLRVYTDDPPNLGTPLQVQDAERLTPVERFYIRSHGSVPELSEADHRVRVDGLVERPISLSVADLRERWPIVTVEAALVCAGNRRAVLAELRPTRSALHWNGDAVGNTIWTGVRLVDVLRSVGVRPGAGHVAFEGADATPAVGDGVRFGGSIPLRAAMDGGTLLAFEMGGRPLLPAHGFPVRLVVPGYVGARSAKWLARLTVQAGPSENPFYATDYRLFAPDVLDPAGGGHGGEPLGETPLDSQITHPLDGDRVERSEVEVRGWALAGGRRTVERVEVTSDGGRTWHEARLDDHGERDDAWRWRRWRCDVRLDAGANELAVRAWDSTGATQPEDPAAIWNVMGYANNAWHRIRVEVDPARPASPDA